MAGVVVARVGAPEIDVLSDLRYEWRVTETGEAGIGARAFRAVSRQWYADHEATHSPFLACLDEEPVGFAWLVTIERVPSPATLARRSGMLQSVFVRSGVRNRGVGTILVEATIAHARELGHQYVMVHPSARSFPFYRRLGFADADRALELRFDE